MNHIWEEQGRTGDNHESYKGPKELVGEAPLLILFYILDNHILYDKIMLPSKLYALVYLKL
jgi:hypothetical protein